MVTAGPELHRLALHAVGTDPQGQIIATASAYDPALAAVLHEEGSAGRPYATRRDGERLIVTCRDVGLVQALTRGAARLQTIAEVMPPASIDNTDGGDWLVVRARSPIQFRVSLGRSRDGRRDALFPDPVRIIGDALSKWRAWGLPEIEEPNAARIGGWLDAYRVEPYRAGRHVWRGWTGAVTMDLSPLGPESRAAIWSLMRFAALRNIGAHTTYGMGAVDVSPVD